MASITLTSPYDNATVSSGDNVSSINASRDDPVDMDAWKGAWYRAVVPVLLLFCVIAFFTNLSILISVRWIRRTLTPTLCFSISLAVADAYASLVVGFGLVINSLLPIGYGYNIGNEVCFILVVEGFRIAGLVISVFHLLMLAVNHYIGIIRPLHYASTMTRRTAMISIAIMWILPLIFMFVYLGGVRGYGLQSEGCMNYTFIIEEKFRMIIGSLFFVPLALMFFMYVHIFVIVMQHNLGLRQYQGSQNFSRNVKAAVTTLVFIGTYALGWMPAVTYYVIVCLDCVVHLVDVAPTVNFAVSLIVNILIIMKLSLNPIIYTARMKDIRLAMKSMLATCFPRFVSGGAGTSYADDTVNSSFIRSRYDTTHGDGSLRTSFRLQSLYSRGRGCNAGEDAHILVYQKSEKQATTKNGAGNGRTGGNGNGGKQNGLIAVLPSGTTVKTFVTSPNNTVTPLIES